jgi:hypothetical protein
MELFLWHPDVAKKKQEMETVKPTKDRGQKKKKIKDHGKN